MFTIRRIAAFAALGLLSGAALNTVRAAAAYDEAVNGDLSGSGASPTSISVGIGDNNIFGSTGRATAVDRDYFTITVPFGLEIESLTVLSGTQVGGNSSFIGMQAGPKVTLPTNAQVANGLLGWKHYGSADVGQDILPAMSVPSNGSSGFNIPLADGKYSFWVQDFNTGPLNYGFDIKLKSIPEGGPGLTMSFLLFGCLLVSSSRVGRRLVCLK